MVGRIICRIKFITNKIYLNIVNWKDNHYELEPPQKKQTLDQLKHMMDQQMIELEDHIHHKAIRLDIFGYDPFGKVNGGDDS